MTRSIYHSSDQEKPRTWTGSRASTPSPAPAPSDHSETWIVRLISRGFKNWAGFVARFPIPIIVLCTILTLVGTAKVVVTPNDNDITGYTPYGARARDEYEVSTEFFSNGGTGVAMFILILPLDKGSVLREEILEEVSRVERTIATNFTILNRETGKQQGYDEFCYSFCLINAPVVQFVNGFKIQSERLKDGSEPNERILLNYPLMEMYGRKMNIQPYFFGVEMHEGERLSIDSNQTQLVGEEAGDEDPAVEDGQGSALLDGSEAAELKRSKRQETGARLSNMRSAKMLALQFRAERTGGWTVQDVKDYEAAISHYFQNEFASPRIRVLTLSTTFVENEVVRAGMTMLPFLIVGFTIMACISSLTVLLSALFMRQASVHKFSLALMACVCPFMACGTALGFLFYFGVRFGSILCVTPFLILAIGVDDAYLMIHAWQRVTAERRKKAVKDDSPGSRLAEVLCDTGPAIIISASTNIFADLCGTYTGSPEITLLAYGNMACIFVDLVYQVSFYSAVMVIVGEFEMRGEVKGQSNVLHIPIGWSEEKGEGIREVASENSSQSGAEDTMRDSIRRKFIGLLDFYVSLLCNKFFDVLIMVCWIAYILFCVQAITRMEINLTPKKLFSADSPLVEMDDYRVEYVIPKYTLATLFINNPGDISNGTRMARLDSFVSELETVPGAWGPVSTNYFMRDFREFEKWQRELEVEESGDEEADPGEPIRTADLDAFVKFPEYEFWRGFIRISKDKDSNETKLDKFFMTTAYQGDGLREWGERGVILRRWRKIVDKYSSEFNITVFNDDGIYLDLIDNMPTDTWQSAVATLACMALICLVFLGDFFTVTVATAAIASIMTGILGILSSTGTELDPIVMAALIISIGFSVDIPAHVTYHYHTAAAHLPAPVTVRDRIRMCLSSVGWPAIQAALSTNLCVLSLLMVKIYMSHVFVKTMVLCISLCVMHGLLLIPCLLSLLSPLFSCCRKSSSQ